MLLLLCNSILRYTQSPMESGLVISDPEHSAALQH
jgi:hypothetical protein